MKKKCRKCPYYHKADAEHADDGCYYNGFVCYKTLRNLRWATTIINLSALIIAIIVLVMQLERL